MVLFFNASLYISKIQKNSILDVFLLLAVKKIKTSKRSSKAGHMATSQLWSIQIQKEVISTQNSQAVKKGCGLQKARVRKDVKFKVHVVAKKWL